MTTRQRLEAQAETFGTVFVLVQHLTRRANAALADWGLTTRQWLLLAVLDKQFPAGDPSLTEAAAAYGTSRQNVKQIALGLESGGWLHLETDPSDARTTRIVRTEKVQRFDEPDGVARSTALLDDVFDSLTTTQVRALRDLTTTWLTALESKDSPAAGPRERRSHP